MIDGVVVVVAVAVRVAQCVRMSSVGPVITNGHQSVDAVRRNSQRSVQGTWNAELTQDDGGL